jgi:hypothetical protein
VVGGTVIDRLPPIGEHGPAVTVELDEPDGQKVCNIERAAFPGRELPELGARVDLDPALGSCALAPIWHKPPRVAMIIGGSAGTVSFIVCAWATSERGRRHRNRTRRVARGK